MSDATIENPVINSPYEEPRRHFHFGDDGITDTTAHSLAFHRYACPTAPLSLRGEGPGVRPHSSPLT